MRDFRLQLRCSAHVLGVEVHGEVDMDTAPQLLQVVSSALESGMRAIQVDLRAVSFIDSMGVSALIQAHQVTSRDGAALVVLGVSPAVARVMELTGVDRYLLFGDPVHPEQPTT